MNDGGCVAGDNNDMYLPTDNQGLRTKKNVHLKFPFIMIESIKTLGTFIELTL